MKNTLAILAIFAVAGCTFTPQQKAVAVNVGRAAASLAQIATDLTIRIILSKATSGQDLQAKANWLDSAASGLRTLENQTDGYVSAQLVGETIRQWTNPDRAHWADYAESLADAFAQSPYTQDEKLQIIAMNLNNTAATTRAVK